MYLKFCLTDKSYCKFKFTWCSSKDFNYLFSKIALSDIYSGLAEQQYMTKLNFKRFIYDEKKYTNQRLFLRKTIRWLDDVVLVTRTQFNNGANFRNSKWHSIKIKKTLAVAKEVMLFLFTFEFGFKYHCKICNNHKVFIYNHLLNPHVRELPSVFPAIHLNLKLHLKSNLKTLGV